MKFAVALAALSLVGASVAHAQVFSTTFSVPNTPPTGNAGYTLTIGPQSLNDRIVLGTNGVAFEQMNPDGTAAYGTNAAGIVTLAGISPNYAVGTTLVSGSTGQTYGALYADFTSTGGLTYTSGPIQVYASNAANGLNSSTPPTSLTYDGTFGSLFGGNFNDLTGGTINFRVSDDPTPPGYTDNSGSYTVTITSAPEPGTWALMLGGVALLGGALRLQVARRRDKETSGEAVRA